MVAGVRISFLFKAKEYSIPFLHIPIFIVNKHLGALPPLAIVSKAAINLGVPSFSFEVGKVITFQ